MGGSDLFFVDRKGHEPRADPADDSLTPLPPSSVKRKRRAPQKAKVAAWVDNDDKDDVELQGQASKEQQVTRSRVDLRALPRRRKLRKSENDTAVSSAEYEQRVREYYAKEGSRIAAGTWAELSSHEGPAYSDSEDDADATVEPEHETIVEKKVSRLLRSTGRILSSRAAAAGGQSKLEAGTIDIRRVGNANGQDPNRAVVQAVEFHPSGRMVMTAGLDKTMRLFQVDGKRNAKIQGVHLQDLPLYSAHFAASGNEVLMMGRRPFFYQFDLGSGVTSRVETLARGREAEMSLENCVVSPDGSRFAIVGGKGRVVLASTKFKQQTGVLRMNTPCGAVAFSASNDHHIYTTGRGGTIHLWDVRKHACVDAHVDEGSLAATAVASAPSHYATGSSVGVVNIYQNSAMSAGQSASADASMESQIHGSRVVAPERVVLNLSTSISAMTFNSDGQLLAFASRALKNAVRLLHVPSMTVYSNWPTQNVNLRRVSCLAFSPSGGFLAAGNDKGEALLFRIRSGYSAF